MNFTVPNFNMKNLVKEAGSTFSRVVQVFIVESESIDDVPRHGLTQRQINSDTLADSSYTYIFYNRE